MNKLLGRLLAALLAFPLALSALPPVTLAAERSIDDILADAFVLDFEGNLPSSVKAEGNLGRRKRSCGQV